MKKSVVHDNLSVGDPRKIETEDLKRSAHNDFATTAELKEREYTGLRYNMQIETVEIWVCGKLERSLTAPNGVPLPSDLQRAYMEVFGIDILQIAQLGS